ncbi:MAG: SpoIIE family protein phosphatase [Caldisericia bacterium]|nr:SpoIIE family protein phosphatase [Caldisericia bacterium]
MLFQNQKKIISEIVSKEGSTQKTYADTWLQAFQMPLNYKLSIAISNHLYTSSSNDAPSRYAISRLGTLISENRNTDNLMNPEEFFQNLFSIIHSGLQKRSIESGKEMTTSLILCSVTNNDELFCCNAGYCKALLYNHKHLYKLNESGRSSGDQEMPLPIGYTNPLDLTITPTEIEFTSYKLKKGDIIVILSPGIQEEKEMTNAIKTVLDQSKDPSVICHRIIQAYQENKSTDSEEIETTVGCIKTI